MESLVNMMRALSDPNRLRSFVALSAGELCVCHFIEMLGLAPSTVSKHMSILKQAGLVRSRKVGRWVHYKLADGKKNMRMRRIYQLVCDDTVADPAILKDKANLKKICCMNPDQSAKNVTAR